jgi:hypothetical protein
MRLLLSALQRLGEVTGAATVRLHAGREGSSEAGRVGGGQGGSGSGRTDVDEMSDDVMVAASAVLDQGLYQRVLGLLWSNWEVRGGPCIPMHSSPACIPIGAHANGCMHGLPWTVACPFNFVSLLSELPNLWPPWQIERNLIMPGLI